MLKKSPIPNASSRPAAVCTRIVLSLVLSFALRAAPAFAEPVITHHRISIELDPRRTEIRVSDTFRVTGGRSSSTFFYLHGGLTIESMESGGRSLQWREEKNENEDYEHAKRYRIALPSGGEEGAEVRVTYAGSVVDSVEDGTTGTFEKRGAFFSSETAWVPTIPESRFTFSMIVVTPQSWEVMSQGVLEARSDGGGRKTTRYASDVPMREIYLVAGPYRFYEADHRGIRLIGLLYNADDATALWETYRAAAVRYLDLYGGRIGPYPYEKFAVVENFRETGYGMPSFTLLGSKVLRFPFIPETSFRHEVLHNWWGNGVFLDPDQGNWCEALTNFMADWRKHEEDGDSAAVRHRLRELQRYWNDPAKNRAVALTGFEQGADPDQSSIGYTKGAFFFHMLRDEVGEIPFARSMRRFYREYRGEEAGWDELRRTIEQETGSGLGRFFAQWGEGQGAPKLRIAGVSAAGSGSAHTASITVAQTAPFFALDVPVRIETADGASEDAFVILDHDAGVLEWTGASPVRRVLLDPGYELFRRLEPSEVPPSVSAVFSGGDFDVVLPDSAGIWSEAVGQWRCEGEVRVRGDEAGGSGRSVITLYDGPGAWVAEEGAESPAHPIARTDSSWVVNGEAIGDGTFFYVRRAAAGAHDGRLEAGLVVKTGDDVVDLARRIPYFGYYGTLLFREGDPVHQGEWEAVPPQWTASE